MFLVQRAPHWQLIIVVLAIEYGSLRAIVFAASSLSFSYRKRDNKYLTDFGENSGEGFCVGDFVSLILRQIAGIFS